MVYEFAEGRQSLKSGANSADDFSVSRARGCHSQVAAMTSSPSRPALFAVYFIQPACLGPRSGRVLRALAKSLEPPSSVMGAKILTFFWVQGIVHRKVRYFTNTFHTHDPNEGPCNAILKKLYLTAWRSPLTVKSTPRSGSHFRPAPCSSLLVVKLIISAYPLLSAGHVRDARTCSTSGSSRFRMVPQYNAMENSAQHQPRIL
mmetsp:Transcript_13448/g.35687  ORF Transcript_13448/g.35687 Transcript_13448/m.35687 type:complete len:203 (+) Transcript_13448:178-786(+)